MPGDGEPSDAANRPDCALCAGDGGAVLVRARRWRIVLADEASYPAFTRVVWNRHVAEMSDLTPADRRLLFDVVLRVESVQRQVLAPDKINLASLGNQVPHLHWHVIPRWHDDRHFPESVWSVSRGDPVGANRRAALVRVCLDAYVGALHAAFARR